jgi:4-aminobutyrate aminotransferase-like enzyme
VASSWDSRATTEILDRTTVGTATGDVERTYELDRRHVFHSWSAQASVDPMVVTRAEGSWLWDGDGRRLLDFTSQLVFTNLGHQHPRVVRTSASRP